MRRGASIIVLVTWLAACSAADGKDFASQPLPQARFPVPHAVFADLMKSFPEGVEGKQEMTLSVSEADDGSNVVLLTLSGLLDDAIGAQQHRAVLRWDRTAWRVTELGQRWKCRR